MDRFLMYVAWSLFCCNTAVADTVYKCQNTTGTMMYQQSKCLNADQSLSSWQTRSLQLLPTRKVSELDKIPYSLEATLGLSGNYLVDGEVGSTSANFMIDTGASIVSLTEATAHSAGLICTGTRLVTTASHVVTACETTISKLTFGRFEFRNVYALVLPDGKFNLMGMNILSQIKIEQGKGKMILSKMN